MTAQFLLPQPAVCVANTAAFTNFSSPEYERLSEPDCTAALTLRYVVLRHACARVGHHMQLVPKDKVMEPLVPLVWVKLMRTMSEKTVSSSARKFITGHQCADPGVMRSSPPSTHSTWSPTRKSLIATGSFASLTTTLDAPWWKLPWPGKHVPGAGPVYTPAPCKGVTTCLANGDPGSQHQTLFDCNMPDVLSALQTPNCSARLLHLWCVWIPSSLTVDPRVMELCVMHIIGRAVTPVMNA